MKNIFFFDIETIPTSNIEVIDDITKNITHPANIKLPKSIAAWNADKKPDVIKKAILETSFDGGAGEIVAFSSCMGDGDIIGVHRNDSTTEVDLLNKINETLLLSFNKKFGDYESALNTIWCGNFIITFDLMFLYKRFVINKIKPSVKVPYNGKAWDNNIYDIGIEWQGGQRNKASMDYICKCLGIKGKEGFDGSMVYQAWLNKEYKKIGLYCGDDVSRSRDIYKRMNFK